MKRILIVEDEPDVCEYLTSILEDMGSDVRIANDGKGALQEAKKFKPDLILMDLHMPQMNGLEALKQIKKLLPQVKVIMLTGSDTTNVMEQALRIGADHYITKPFEMNRLCREVRRFLGEEE